MTIPFLVALLALVGAFGLFPGAPMLAQGTPTPINLDVPAPAECQTEPRPFPIFPAGAGQRAAATPLPLTSPSQTPFVAPSGDPADAATVAAVTATVRESLACRNAGDYPRAYALFTERMLVELFGGPATIDPAVRDAIANGPRPLPPAGRIGLVAIDHVVILPDGRAGALVTTATARRLFRDYLYFAKDPATGRWLIDETVALGDG